MQDARASGASARRVPSGTEFGNSVTDSEVCRGAQSRTSCAVDPSALHGPSARMTTVRVLLHGPRG